MKFCVTTTAVVRPKILEATYNSFFSKLQNCNLKDWPLFLHIDAVPEPQFVNEVKQVAEKYFSNVNCFINTGKPNTALANKRLWLEVKSYDVVFNLEDDWELVKPVDFNKFLSKMKHDFTQIKFRKFNCDCNPRAEREKINLSPGFWPAEVLFNIAQKMTSDICPEVQLRMYAGAQKIFIEPKYPCVKDIGRLWREKYNLQRPKIKRDFITWKEYL